MSDLAAFRRVVEQFSGATALLEGPDLVVGSASPAYLNLVGGRELIGRPLGEVVPELAEHGFVARMARAYETGEFCRQSQVPVRWRRGDAPSEALLEFVCTPLRHDGRIAALVLWMDDVTERARAAEALRQSEERLSVAQSAGGVGTFDWDLVTGRVIWTEQEERLFGLEPGTFEGSIDGWSSRVYPEDGERIMESFRACWAERREEVSFEFRIRHPDGGMRWLAGGGRFFYAPDGTPLRMVGVNLDVTERNRALAERDLAVKAERAAREHVQVLADAGTVLAGSLDMRETLDRLARLVVPSIADWCFVEAPTADGRIEPVVVHHPDPEMVAEAHGILARYPIDPGAAYGTAKVLRTGEPEVVPEIPDEVLVAVAQGPEHLATLRRLGFRSHISLPLTARGSTLGVLSLVTGQSGRRLDAEDLPFAQELARKAAVAIDNARLFAAEQEARRSAEREAERSRRLRDLAAELNRSATPEEVARACVVHGLGALGAAAGSLALLSDDGASFEVVESRGYPDEVSAKWRRFPVTPGRPLSDAVATRTPVLLGTRGDWAAAYPGAAADGIGTELACFAAVPVALGGRVLAGLSFSFPDERHFDESDRTFLTTLGEQAAQALERARLLETERRAREAAEEANRAKTEFLSAMSHELRTPLNAISGYVDLMDLGIHGPVTDAQSASLRRIKRAQEVLLSLINDVLNYARVEAGRLEIDREAVNVGESLAALEPLIAPQVSAGGLEYACEPCDGALQVMGDGERIRQVLLNLLTNAVKFTRPGGRIVVSAAESGGTVFIRVSDTGRGIPADKLETIFDPFVQVDRHRTEASQQGVGLGLAISRELARAMGGDLLAESTPGRGSTFTLTLAAASEPGRFSRPPPSPPEPSPSPVA